MTKFEQAACSGLLVILTAGSVYGQPSVSNTFELTGSIELAEAEKAREAERHLERIDALLADRQWDEAVERLRMVMEDYGDGPIHRPQVRDGRDHNYDRYVTVRNHCHWRLVRLADTHPEALRLYRQQVDPLGARWYNEGLASRDQSALLRVVHELFSSSYGDDALYALGEMALERGDTAAARNHWEQISSRLRTPNGRSLAVELSDLDLEQNGSELVDWLSAPRQDPWWLAYPDTDLDLNHLRALLVLVSILEGSDNRARLELDIFRRVSADSHGRFLGQDVKYADALETLMEKSRQWPRRTISTDWPTFAGTVQRNGHVDNGVDITPRPIWSIPLGRLRSPDTYSQFPTGTVGRRVAENSDALLSYHPVVIGNLLLINDQNHVKAHDALTGQPAFGRTGVSTNEPDAGIIFRPRNPHEPSGTRPARRMGVPRFTMTVDNNRLFARMGSVLTSRIDHGPYSRNPGYLIGLDLDAEGKLLPGFPILPDDDTWFFEGSPVTDGDQLYVLMRKDDAANARSHIACFDTRTGRIRWRRMLVSADTPGHGLMDQISSALLTLNEGTLYCNTNLGVVAAISTGDGSIEWITTYPRTNRGDFRQLAANFYRDLNPCLYKHGLLYVAPTDSASLFALDANTGQLIWENPLPEDVVHLLGVGNGRLVASGDRLWWLNAYTGRVIPNGCFPPYGGRTAGHAAPSPAGLGRGLLTDNQVWWPTSDGIYVFDQRSAQHVRTINLATSGSPVGGDGGNLLISNGQLFLVTPDRLFAFNQSGRTVQRTAGLEVSDR